MSWGALVALVWIAVIASIAVAAGDDEPTIAAGSLVTGLAVAMFVAGAATGALGRDRRWTAWFAATIGVVLGVAAAVAVLVRGEWASTVWAPMIAVVTGMLGWLVTALGWLVGAVLRSGLGDDDRTDDGII